MATAPAAAAAEPLTRRARMGSLLSKMAAVGDGLSSSFSSRKSLNKQQSTASSSTEDGGYSAGAEPEPKAAKAGSKGTQLSAGVTKAVAVFQAAGRSVAKGGRRKKPSRSVQPHPLPGALEPNARACWPPGRTSSTPSARLAQVCKLAQRFE